MNRRRVSGGSRRQEGPGLGARAEVGGRRGGGLSLDFEGASVARAGPRTRQFSFASVEIARGSEMSFGGVC